MVDTRADAFAPPKSRRVPEGSPEPGRPRVGGGAGLDPGDRRGRARPVVSGISPMVDGGRYPVKRTVGELVTAEADAFTDGHDVVCCAVRFRHEEDRAWHTAPMGPLGNDRFRGAFAVDRPGRWRFAVRATIDRFATWRRALEAKAADGQEISTELLVGAALVESTAARARGEQRRALEGLSARLTGAASAAAGGDSGPGM
jgi:starch synthase (maltosyl-transferring)